MLTPAMKSLSSGTCARTLFPMTRLARLPFVDEPSATLASEEGDERRHAARLGILRDVRRRIDSQDRDSRAHEVLEQVAVVRGQLDDEIVRPELEPRADHLDVRARVIDP